MLLSLLRQTIKNRGFTLTSVAKQLSEPRDHSWLSRALDGSRRLAIHQIGEILDIVGEPRDQFWRRHLEEVGGLRHAEFGDVEPPVLLRSIAGQEPKGILPIFRTIASDSLLVLDRDPVTSLRRLRDLDALRQRDPEAGYQRALEWVEECQERVRARRNSRNAQADLIGSLGVFASAARVRGQSHLAAFVLSCAFERIGAAQSGLLFADLLTRSGSILVEQGFPTLAVSFLERALGIFWILEKQEEELRTALSLGTHYLHLGRNDAAIMTFSRCLKHEAVSDEQKSMAVGNLAWLQERTKRPEEALALIANLGDGATEQPNRLSTNLRWIKARALYQCGELYAAAGIFATLENHVARFCDPADPFLLFCDYAAVLIRLGDLRQLAAAAEASQRYLERLHDAPMLAALVSEALEETLKGVSDITGVRRLRQAISIAASST